jgi:hypothetical protein
MRDRRRWIAIIATAATLCGLGFLVAPSTQAASGPTFPVMNTSETPPDGVWFRNSPQTANTDRVTGHGVYAGDVVQLQCYAWGDAVGAYNNTLWYYANNVTRPTVSANGQPNVGFLNAHYINDGQAANVVDAGVPACVNNQPPPPAASPTVTLTQGPAAPAGYWYAITLSGFAANTAVAISCYDSVSPGGFAPFSLTTDGNGNASTASYCYSGDGPDHWVVAGGIASNHVTWGASGTGGGGSPPPTSSGPTYIDGHNIGYPTTGTYTWGSCLVQNFDGGPWGFVVASYSNGTQAVHGGMLQGWLDNRGALGLGCPTNEEHAYVAGSVRQDFTGGSLFWTAGMGHAARVTWSDGSSKGWAGYLAKTSKVTHVDTTFTVPTISCAATAGKSRISLWAGIDGVTTNKYLLQAGVAALCSSSTSAAQYALFTQSDPSKTGQDRGTVNALDSVHVSVDYTPATSKYLYTLQVNGVTKYHAGGKLAGEPLTSGECIAEAPFLIGGAVAPLANFGTIAFSGCAISRNGASSTTQIATTNGLGALRQDIDRVGLRRATTGVPASRTGSFSVIWNAP